MKKLLLVSTAITLSACTTYPSHKRVQATYECMNYRQMMTSPMPPEAMQRLHQACNQSMRR